MSTFPNVSNGLGTVFFLQDQVMSTFQKNKEMPTSPNVSNGLGYFLKAQAVSTFSQRLQRIR